MNERGYDPFINAGLIARQRHIDFETVIAADHGEDRLALEIETDG